MQFEKFELVCIDVSAITIIFNNATISTDYDKLIHFILLKTIFKWLRLKCFKL